MSWPSVLRTLFCASTRPPDQASLFVPSKRTIAPSGGFAPSVGLSRTVFFRAICLPSGVSRLNVVPSAVPEYSCCPAGGNFSVAENSSGLLARYLRFPLAGVNLAEWPSSLPALSLLFFPSPPPPPTPPPPPPP